MPIRVGARSMVGRSPVAADEDQGRALSGLARRIVVAVLEEEVRPERLLVPDLDVEFVAADHPP